MWTFKCYWGNQIPEHSRLSLMQDQNHWRRSGMLSSIRILKAKPDWGRAQHQKKKMKEIKEKVFEFFLMPYSHAMCLQKEAGILNQFAVYTVLFDSPTEPRTTEPRTTEPRTTEHRLGILSEWTQLRVGLNPEWTQSRRDSTPNGLNPDWTQPRMDWTQNGFNCEWTELNMGLNIE